MLTLLHGGTQSMWMIWSIVWRNWARLWVLPVLIWKRSKLVNIFTGKVSLLTVFSLKSSVSSAHYCLIIIPSLSVHSMFLCHQSMAVSHWPAVHFFCFRLYCTWLSLIFKVANRNRNRVTMWAVIECSLILLVAAVQIMRIRNFFEYKRKV